MTTVQYQIYPTGRIVFVLDRNPHRRDGQTSPTPNLSTLTKRQQMDVQSATSTMSHEQRGMGKGESPRLVD